MLSVRPGRIAYMFKFILLALLLIPISGVATARAQAPGKAPTARSSRNQSGSDSDTPELPEEMRFKLESERKEKDYQKLVDSAAELSDLSAEVAKQYKESPTLSADQVKKLASIEKLAKRILAQSGGEEVSEKSGEQPVPIPEAVEKLAATAAEVKKAVTTATRFVVSATVIANSNDVIHLAQYIRRGQK